MKNTAAIALLVARAAADEVGTGRADMKADHDRVVPGTVFQAATDEDGACVDAGVTTAKGELDSATEAWQAEVDQVDGNATLAPPVTGTKAAIATAAGEMANAIGAVNTMNPVPANTDGSLTEPDATPTAGGQKELILADVAADLLSLTTRLTSNEALALQTSSKLTLDAKQALWNDANSANTLALGVQTKAGDAVTEATKHLAQTGADKTAAITDMNTAMVAWKGTSGAGASGAVDDGKTSWATEASADPRTAADGADSATKKQAYAWNDLTVAVGSCTADADYGPLAVYTTCSSTATATAGGLVRLALRQKLIAENIVKRTTEKTAMLTAFCLANVALGSPKATIEAGEEYYERADPGVRSDFAFIAATAVIGNEANGTTKDSFQTLGTIELAAAQEPSSVVGDQRKSDLVCTGDDSYSGTTGDVGDASIIAKPYGLLSAAITAQVSPAATYATWKGLADTAMTAYALMIATDTGYAEEQKSAAANGCDVLATPVIVLTVYTDAKQAAVTATDTVALRPSNLVEDMTTPTDAPTLVTACKDACNKLPSFGLTVTGATTTLTPTAIKEVCQGVQVPVAWDTNLATSSPKCKFISSAAIGAQGGAVPHYAAITAAGTLDAANACHKRRMDKGKLWYDAMVVTNSGAKTGEYASDDITAAASGIDGTGAYKLYLDAVDTWITARQLVMDKYTGYLHAKYVVQELGAATLKSEDNKLRAVARLSGTSTTTNNNIQQAYKAAWELAFYTTADVAAAVWAAAPQDADLVTDYAQLVQTAAFAGTPDEDQNLANLATLGYTTIAGHQDGARTDLHAKWLASKVVSGEKQALYDTQKAAYDSTVLAVDAQTALKAQAETDKAAADLVVTNADAATPTGTSEALATALADLSSADALVTWLEYDALDTAARSALTTPQKTSANGVYNIARADYDAKLVLATNAKSAVDLLQANVAGTGALSATMLAYQSLAALRATAAGKVTATTEAIEANRLAVVELDAKLVIKNAKAMLHRKALTTCMNTKYDNYKTTMNAAIQSKITDLKDIKSLLDGAAKPAPGATNARCEKGLSQGNGRASRAAPCTDAANCCGAAKGPVVAAATWADAPTMTIELCMPIATKTYSYVPPRAPMATTAPASTQSWPFACIAGASKLAAAATALATTAYMMA